MIQNGLQRLPDFSPRTNTSNTSTPRSNVISPRLNINASSRRQASGISTESDMLSSPISESAAGPGYGDDLIEDSNEIDSEASSSIGMRSLASMLPLTSTVVEDDFRGVTKVDRFGFIYQSNGPTVSADEASRGIGLMCGDTPLTEEEMNELKERHRARIILDASRELKWWDMINNWQKFQKRHPRTLSRRIKKGIPDSLRGVAWQLISRSRDLQMQNPSRYQQLLREESDMEETIMRDINRTFPTHIFFRDADGQGQRSLLNVLKAYSVYDPAVGYCQGMGFITGLLLLYMKEEDAFWLLVRLLKAYEMDGLYKNRLPLLGQRLFQLDALLNDFLPQLASHFVENGIHSSMYATEWFITVFTSNFPFSSVLRIWDIYLHEGVLIVFRVALALLAASQTQLLQLDFEGLMEYLKRGEGFRRLLMDPDKMVECSLQLPLRASRLQELDCAYQKQKASKELEEELRRESIKLAQISRNSYVP